MKNKKIVHQIQGTAQVVSFVLSAFLFLAFTASVDGFGEGKARAEASERSSAAKEAERRVERLEKLLKSKTGKGVDPAVVNPKLEAYKAALTEGKDADKALTALNKALDEQVEQAYKEIKPAEGTPAEGTPKDGEYTKQRLAGRNFVMNAIREGIITKLPSVDGRPAEDLNKEVDSITGELMAAYGDTNLVNKGRMEQNIREFAQKVVLRGGNVASNNVRVRQWKKFLSEANGIAKELGNADKSKEDEVVAALKPDNDHDSSKSQEGRPTANESVARTEKSEVGEVEEVTGTLMREWEGDSSPLPVEVLKDRNALAGVRLMVAVFNRALKDNNGDRELARAAVREFLKKRQLSKDEIGKLCPKKGQEEGCGVGGLCAPTEAPHLAL